ncbi:MAG: putative F420-dependent oxidoreductase [Candidatus Azotimanducaceae bacterium]|jgi:probable F420-dependent oxidoreductase
MKIGVSLPIREMAGDLGAIRAFAQLSEDLGLTHLRIPEQIMRPGNGYLHESMTLLAWIAGFTKKIELVPSVIILPNRQTVLFAKQAAELDILTNGRTRIGIGVGSSKEEYGYLGVPFESRGRRCNEQMKLLQALWTQTEVNFEGEFDQVSGAGLNPLPIQRPIPLWIGARSSPSKPIIRRIGQQADGWFVLCDPSDYPSISEAIGKEAEAVGRKPADVGTEAGVAVVGPRAPEWQARVANWEKVGLTHLCLRTLGADLSPDQHLKKLQEVVPQIPRT